MPRYFGVAFDGFKIAFITYRREKVRITQGAYNVGLDTPLRLLEAIRGFGEPFLQSYTRKVEDAYLGGQA